MESAEALARKKIVEVGKIVGAGKETILQAWSDLCTEEVDSARHARRAELRNDLPEFLDELSKELLARGEQRSDERREKATSHGNQRWRNNWKLEEVVSDFQLLRLAILNVCRRELERPLTPTESDAICVIVDKAIKYSVVSYVANSDRALRDSETEARGTFENVAIGVAQLNSERTVLRGNRRLQELLGYEAEELAGRSLDDLVGEADQRMLLTRFDALLAKDAESFSCEIRMRHRDGLPIWAGLTVSRHALQTDDEEARHLIAFVEDISMRKRLESSLQVAKVQAEQANRMKSEFVANVSHEIRTPMNAILGMTELALDEELLPEVRDFIVTAHESARSLLALVNDLLDFSRIEAGKLQLETVPFDLWQTIDDVAKALSIRASEKGLELATEIAPNVPRMVEGDPLRLRQVLSNLAANAVKFTERGEVVIRSELHASTDQHLIVRFAVRDTGIGISPEDKVRIFAPFTQADASTTRMFGGSGLGLAICSELIGAFGGKLDVDSEVGKGSEFYFTARLKRPAPDSVDDQLVETASLQGAHVLVVDDSATNRRIISEILKQHSAEVESLDDGTAAIELMQRRAAAGSPFDIVMVDALMPGRDGFSVIEEINSNPQLANATALMLSSADRSTFADRIESINVDGFLEKPVSRRELVGALASVASGEAPRAQPAHEAQPLPQSLSILVAEDTPANQKLVETLLRKRGHSVALASNGREAVEKLYAENYDVILMDVQMPTMDGYQATAAIRDMEDRADANHRDDSACHGGRLRAVSGSGHE